MKILVVEDNPISRKLTRLALETEGFGVIEAANGQSAIDAVTRDHPDLILQDLLLPDLDGFELVHRLHELTQTERVPILALMGLIAAGDEKKLPTAPFADYLFKPVEPSFLDQHGARPFGRQSDLGTHAGIRTGRFGRR